MKTKILFAVLACIAGIGIFSGCGSRNNDYSLPQLFLSANKFDPVNNPGIYNCNVNISVTEVNLNMYMNYFTGDLDMSDTLSSATVTMDGVLTLYTSYSSRTVSFTNLWPGRHIVTIACPDYDSKNIIFNLPGDGLEQDLTFGLNKKGK